MLSCMDCGKDFYGDEYASHTKCISEAAKYQGSFFKESGRAADGAGKGEKKQQEWLEVCMYGALGVHSCQLPTGNSGTARRAQSTRAIFDHAH